jgi:hypothetical protein
MDTNGTSKKYKLTTKADKDLLVYLIGDMDLKMAMLDNKMKSLAI